jgi:hypothetical protein
MNHMTKEAIAKRFVAWSAGAGCRMRTDIARKAEADLAAVWVIEPEIVIDENPAVRRKEEAKKPPSRPSRPPCQKISRCPYLEWQRSGIGGKPPWAHLMGFPDLLGWQIPNMLRMSEKRPCRHTALQNSRILRHAEKVYAAGIFCSPRARR